jgi:hypothetical protein
MNHQPFREWLLSDDYLTVEQTIALKDHINTCESCRHIDSAWKELESAMQKVQQVDPASGFTTRWRIHLNDYQHHQKQRRGWMTIGFTSIIVISLLIILITQIWSLVQSPSSYLVIWLTRLVSLVTIYYTLQNMITSYTGIIGIYTFVGLFFLIGIISFMSVLWLTAYRKLSMARRLA